MDGRYCRCATEGRAFLDRGSVIALSDDTGAAITTDIYTYGPYGEVYAGSGSGATLPSGGSRFRYTGQVYDGETGLYYYSM